jgi:hypothetical protein
VSTLSKVFVVINLLLAVAFATLTVALFSKRVTYYNDKIELKKRLEANIQQLEKEKADVIADRDKEKAAKEAAISQRDTAKGEAIKYAKEAEASKVAAESDKARADIAAKSQALLAKQVEVMRQELEKGRQIVVKLKERETVLRSNEAELKKERDALKNDVNRARLDLAELHRDRKRIAEELANAEYVIASLIKKGIDVYKHVGPGALGAVPDVRTKVVDVRPATGHVALGAGKDSGIKEGFVFLIHRGDQYIGKVRITTVWNNFSGGTILERKLPIKSGDDAMTDTAPTP